MPSLHWMQNPLTYMDRHVVAEELSRFFGVLAHPLRVLIIEELRNGERTVTDLKDALDVPQATVSQHLGILRANRVVLERRDGRHVFYHLRHQELANLVVECIFFVSPDQKESRSLLSAMNSTRSTWSKQKSEKTASKPAKQKPSR
ncbi:MAG TPA: metalloregulator ArsR/SmtB family transcription factor [Candidatus Melainabacteria bacterium]|nr:metalloregulator ArsR/SmtB family transcription factor [Candidatus Melainabacteria bacterium]